MYFQNYRLRKTWLDKCIKNLGSEDPLTSNMVNSPKHCSKLWRQHLDYIYWSFGRKFSWKKPLSLISKILGPFVNTLTLDDIYSLLNSDDITQPIQIQLSKKQRTFSELFYKFLKDWLNFEHFEKHDDDHSLCISEITDCERRG